jgi:hypothetical protein
MAPVARGTTPIQAHTGPPSRPGNQSETRTDTKNTVDSANVEFHGFLLGFG